MREYEVIIGGLPHTIQLPDDEAAARGLTPLERPSAKQAPAPKNKARTAPTKG